jgi:hypothetical protein
MARCNDFSIDDNDRTDRYLTLAYRKLGFSQCSSHRIDIILGPTRNH